MDFFRRLILKTRLSRHFYKLFFSSIILIAMILLILGGVVYVNFINTFQSEVEDANIVELTQIVNNMDMRFKEMDCIAVDIGANPEFDYFSSIGALGSGYRMVRELKKYKSGNEFLYDIIYYSAYGSESDRRIISANGEMDIDLFFKYIYHYDHWGKKQFFHLMKHMDMREVRPIEPVRLNNQFQTRVITCIYPLPINAVKPARVVWFTVEQGVLNHLLKNVLKDYSGYVYVLDEKNRLIVSTAKDAAAKDAADLLAQLKRRTLTAKVNKLRKNGINYSVIKLASDYNGWKYVTVIRTDQFMSRVYRKENFFYISIFLMVVVGTMMAFGLARQNNKPLQKLLENLSGGGHNYFAQKYRDDIEYIAEVIDQIRAKNRYLLKEQFLFNVLHAKYNNPAEITADLHEADLQLARPNFLVCVFLIDNDSRLVNKIKFNLIDVLEELAAQSAGFNGCATEIDDRSYALLVNFDAAVDMKAEITDLLLYVKDFFEQYSSFTIGVGRGYAGVAKIKQSYEEAKRAVYYRLVKGKNRIIFYEQIQAEKESTYKYPVDLETALIKAIKHSDQDEVAKSIQELKAFIANQHIPLESLRCICYGIINSVLKIVDDLQIDASDCFLDEEDYLLVQAFDTVEAMLDQLAVFCLKICEYQIEQKENKGLQLKNKIFTIINRRLHDQTLSLESMAADCGVSPSYISRYFKQQTGSSLMQFVDRRRMNEVKELLAKTNQSLNEILNQVGYIDKANFIRKFKRVEGLTPMKYRELHRR
jgi:two-component system response regulator YesN